jgi:hypothetical protein
MTRPAVVRSLILGCAGELDAVTFAGVVATATKQEQHECARQLAESWLARETAASSVLDLSMRQLFALGFSIVGGCGRVVNSSRSIANGARGRAR